MLISNRKWMEIQEAFWKAVKGDEESIVTLQVQSPHLHEKLSNLLLRKNDDSLTIPDNNQ